MTPMKSLDFAFFFYTICVVIRITKEIHNSSVLMYFVSAALKKKKRKMNSALELNRSDPLLFRLNEARLIFD
jgi:hypothetical protein